MKPIFELVFEFATIVTISMVVLYILKARYFEKKEEQHFSLNEHEESLTRKHLAGTFQGYLCFELIFLVSLFLFLQNFENVFLQRYFNWKTALMCINFGVLFFSAFGVLVTMLNLLFSTFASVLETIEEVQENISE